MLARWRARIPGPALAPIALILFWVLLLPLVTWGSGWALGKPPAESDRARQEFLAGDYGRALADYRGLASGGSAEAAYWLAHMLELGLGGKPGGTEAVHWYEQAAAGGMVAAQRRLGEIERDGVLAPQDAAKARDWLKQAAQSGDAVAERELGLLWRDGIGGGKDPIEAYVWLALAARHGDQPAAKLRDRLLGQMSAADQSEAEALAARRSASASAPFDAHTG
jgi:TPR repeat protein